MKKHLVLFMLILFMGFTQVGWGQVNIAAGGNITENFDAIGTTATATLPTGWKVENVTGVRTVTTAYSLVANTATTYALTYNAAMSSSASNGRWNFGGTTASDRAVGGISSGTASKSVNMYLQITNNGASSINDFTISYDAERFRNGSNAAGFSIRFYYSTTGNASSYVEDAGLIATFAANADNLGSTTNPLQTISVSNITLSQSLAAGSSLYLVWSYSVTSGTTTSNAQALGIDNISITANGAAGTPTVAVSTSSLTNFGSVSLGSSSAEQSYTVSGTDLTNDIVITPPTDFEISQTSGSGFATTPITLTQTGGTVNTTTIYARFTPQTTGVKSANISNVSTDATTQNVSVSGTGTNSNTSDIIEQTSFTYPTNIDYTTYQNANIVGDAGDIEVAQFTIRDGGGAGDGDALGTTLTAITFTLTNYANVRSIALYDGASEIGTETAGATSVTFSGLTLTASDAGTKDFSVRVSFNTSVTDNQQIQLTVTSASYDAAGSAFATASAGGAVSSIAGDNNRIEVTATKLAFTSVPTSMNVNGTFGITVKAQDANNNTDLDNIASVTLAKNTGTGILSSATGLIQSLASGAYSWSDLQYTVAESFDLSVSASGLTSATSSSITGVNGPNQGDIFITHLSPGYNTATDEFVVLFNNSSSTIDLNGYELRYFSAAGNAGAALISFSTSTSIPSKKYILLSSVVTVSVGSANSTRDYTMSSGMATSGQVALRNTSQTSNIIYAVAWGTITGYTASMADAATYSGTGMISLTASGDTYTRTSYNSNNSEYSFTAAASIVDIPTSGTSALPVELTSFTASVSSHTRAILTWKTATEVNNYGFDIERTVNLGDKVSMVSVWSKVGFVNGAGNSNSPKEYSFTDKSATSGKYLYRLKQLDNDGQCTYSEEVEVALGTPTAFALEQNYPNPFNPATSMQYSVSSLPNGTVGKQFVTIKVFDMLGREVAVLVNGEREPGTYTTEFATIGLASGTYIYRMQAGEFVQTKKMVILK